MKLKSQSVEDVVPRVVPPRRRLRALISLAAAALALVAGVGIAAPASAATPTLDSFVQVTGMTQSNSGYLYIYVTLLKDVPSQAGIKAQVLEPKASRATAPYSSWPLSGKAGKQTLISVLPQKMGVFRVALTLNAPGLNEERDWYLLNSPPTFTSNIVMTPALVVANVVAAHVPGALMTFLPAVKTVKVAGMLLEGWTIYTDIQQAFSGALNGCPALAVGQVYQTVQTTNLNGNAIQIWVAGKIWTSQENQTKGLPPACSFKYKLAEYS